MHTEQLFLAYRWLEALGDAGSVAGRLKMFECSLLSLAPVAELVPEHSCTTEFTTFSSQI
jgi:hypothetical protein